MLKSISFATLAGFLLILNVAGVVSAEETDSLAAWRTGVVVKPVASHTDRHVIHSYFNTCPESPDGKHVVYYTSSTKEGESGDLRILERETGRETIIATSIIAEDAHRAACQQWSCGGKVVVYHNCREHRWFVMAYHLETQQTSVLAEDRQVSFGDPDSSWVPIYGCHWNPGEHRDLQLVNAQTGEIKTVVTVKEVVSTYGEWIQKSFGTTDVSIFFPIVSPDSKRVFFKISRPSGSDDYRSGSASYRIGKVIYDLEAGQFIRLAEKWGHPSWSPDSQEIFEKGNFAMNVETGKTRRCAPSCFSDHPSIGPNGLVFVTDADVTKRNLRNPGDWAIGVGSMTKDEFVVIDIFNNSQGARSWRHNHPHPIFSADGKRIYYNVNAGPWTTLMVAS
ncbi:MAG: PD40 domain-containing protein, partial [Planctomycetaceae bacterium]|nr:PD40 domain-containing protein [Planctomycetaceae bacterium]